MIDDSHHTDETENRPDDHQRAVEASEHAVDALRNSDLSHAHTYSMKPVPPSSAPSTTALPRRNSAKSPTTAMMVTISFWHLG